MNDTVKTANEENKEISEYERLRDNLKLKAHLFKGEASDIWESAEKKWAEYEGKLKTFQENADESKEDIGAALTILRDEIGESYKKLKGSLN
jgi:hypothetical protein